VTTDTPKAKKPGRPKKEANLKQAVTPKNAKLGDEWEEREETWQGRRRVKVVGRLDDFTKTTYNRTGDIKTTVAVWRIQNCTTGKITSMRDDTLGAKFRKVTP
jgi:hypothetical protein